MRDVADNVSRHRSNSTSTSRTRLSSLYVRPTIIPTNSSRTKIYVVKIVAKHVAIYHYRKRYLANYRYISKYKISSRRITRWTKNKIRNLYLTESLVSTRIYYNWRSVSGGPRCQKLVFVHFSIGKKRFADLTETKTNIVREISISSYHLRTLRAKFFCCRSRNVRLTVGYFCGTKRLYNRKRTKKSSESKRRYATCFWATQSRISN